ncbi:MAG: hypothetical protein KAT56_03925, partial [Sedimentisphaerales bacterium]|nr:hypothetical protein [Sedimentisphaerales bacterium]
GKKIESRFKTDSEADKRQYQDRLAEIQTKYESELNTLDTNTKLKRDGIAGNSEAHEQDAKKNCEYELMLAETIADGALKKCQQEHQEIEAAIPAAKQRFENIQEQADIILRLYRQNIPSEPNTNEPADFEMIDPVKTFRKKQELALEQLNILNSLSIPRLFIGIRPFVCTISLCGTIVGLMWLINYLNVLNLPSFYITGSAVFLVSLVVILLLGKILWTKGKTQINAAYEPFQKTIFSSYVLLDQYLKLTLEELDQRKREAVEKRADEVQKAQKQFDTIKAGIAKRREASLQQIEDTYKPARSRLDENRTHDLQQVEQEHQNRQQELRREYDRNLLEI